MRRKPETMFEVGVMAGHRSLVKEQAAPIGALHLPSLAGLDSEDFRAKQWFWKKFLDPQGQYEVMP